MKTAAPVAPPVLVEVHRPRGAWAGVGGKAAALGALTKPKVAALVLVTVAAGFLLGARHAPAGATAAATPTLVLTLIGTGLVAAGASAWNQVMERVRDGRMRRTAGRPLPRGLLAPAEAMLFGTALAVAGLALLALGPHLAAARVALATFGLYVLAYTPLKARTTLNTAVGAVPGALPPVIGWAAATGTLGIEALALFLIVFLWQFPHFLAIAWIYREDYARAGYKMLPAVDPRGARTGRQAVVYALALVPVGLLPATIGLAGPWYFVGALGLGLYYLACAVRFWSDVTDATARGLLRASFLYLPAILWLLLANPLPA
ncbi:MAG TPA: heme o synthase [Isosphaeraceae bacterium]|jgi:protoheme IX farnesyltransferase